jgi:alpha-glucan,water dikinase
MRDPDCCVQYIGANSLSLCLVRSVPMDTEDERVVDYSSDPLLLDLDFQKSVLTKIVEAGAAIEELYGSAQDVEGVIKDGELYVVQTRPQM